MFQQLKPPKSAEAIAIDKNQRLIIPDHPVIPYIEGDGIGGDITVANKLVLDAAVKKAYGGRRELGWFEILAGDKALAQTGEVLPKDTIEAIKQYKVAIKGPLTTPVGGGMRSLNVTLRQVLDLYACVRPVRYYAGTPCPVKEPEKVDMIIFRENTEDVYAGIEWAKGSKEAHKVIDFLNREFKLNLREDSGIGIKPMSEFGSKRLVRKAIEYALKHQRRSVTLVHKGNIMKYTEGAFKEWGYELAKSEFADQTITEDEVSRLGGKPPSGKILIKDRIADNMFQQILLKPADYDLLATPNLNGDYLSDALAAQVGGLGMAPGGNLSDHCALFEATHGTAPKYAGKDVINPSSLILSGVMMLIHMGWQEAAELVERGLAKTILAKTVTYDLERDLKGAKLLKCSEFARAIVNNME